MKIFVTGGAGFIGSHLTEQLLREGHAVAVIDELAPPGNGPAAAEKLASMEPAAKPMTAVLMPPPKLRVTCECTALCGSECGEHNVGSHSSAYVRVHPFTPVATEPALTCRPLPSTCTESHRSRDRGQSP